MTSQQARAQKSYTPFEVPEKKILLSNHAFINLTPKTSKRTLQGHCSKLATLA